MINAFFVYLAIRDYYNTQVLSLNTSFLLVGLYIHVLYLHDRKMNKALLSSFFAFLICCFFLIFTCVRT